MNIKENESALYNVAKTVAALLVVIAHATVMYTPDGAYEPLNASVLMAAVTDFIYQFHMPLFVFLSGTVYAICIEKGKYQDNREFVINKARRLMIPYFAFGFLYVAPAMCLLGLTEQSYLRYCFDGIFLATNARHLWYLEALFWIFCMAILYKPLLNRSTGSRLAALVIALVIYYFKDHVPAYFKLRNACQYQLYFVSGAVFHYYYRQVVDLVRKVKSLCFLLPLVVLASLWFNPNRATDLVYQFAGIAMTLAACMYILSRHSGLLQSKWYRCLEKNSFGIYLFHPMIIYTLFHFLGGFDIPPVLLSFGATAVAILVSIGATNLMRKLRLQILIGE